jgi:hypothetical protein
MPAGSPFGWWALRMTIDRRSTGLRFPVRRLGRERRSHRRNARHSVSIITHLIRRADEQLVAQRFQRLQHAAELLSLKWRRNSQSEETLNARTGTAFSSAASPFKRASPQ